mgnify:CR=1 FL=1
MLNRIVIINSQLYSKADILLSDASGIQLAAESNVGKSSLINTLNFLYIIDTNQMRFEGGSRLKDSIPHYFKNINQSYILFEIFKQGYYCILVKGNANNDIEYYKIDTVYKEEYFIRDEDGKQAIINFQEVQSNFLTQDINFQELTKENLYDLVYSESKKTKAVVWITDKVKRKGRSLNNNFTKIYRFLLKSSEITDDDFKKSLITADNKDIVLPVFADRSKDEITELESKQKKITRLKTIGTEYQQLKMLVDELHSKTKICCKLKFNFNKQFGQIEKELAEKIGDASELSIHIKTLETTINEVLTKEKDKLNQDLGAIGGKIENERNNNLKPIETILEEIEPYGEKGSLQYYGVKNEFETIKKEYEDLITLLTTIKQFNLTDVQVKNDQLIIDKESIDKKIKNFGNLLYQKISSDKKIRAKVYSLLSKEVLEQTEEKIIDKITKTEKVLGLFDGSIDISAIKEKPFETIEELNSKSNGIEAEIKKQQGILETILDRKKKEKKSEELEKSKNEKQALLLKINNKPELLERKTKIEQAIKDLEKSVLDTKEAITKKEGKIEIKKEELKRTTNERKNLRERLEKYSEWYGKINSFREYLEAEELSELEFEKIFPEFEKTNNSLSRLKETIHGSETEKGLFNVVSKKLEKDTASLFDFIREVDEELATLSELENSASELLELISHKFTKPTADFLQRYNEFKNFVKNYNRQLSDFPVSNIKELSIRVKDNEDLITDLKKISSISSLSELFSHNPEQQENLRVLKNYFEQGTEYKFEQLFDLILEIELKTGEKKKIKLGQQVESNATDRVLKLFLFLSIIKELAVNDAENKIAIYIDELGAIGPHNVRQIIKFCNTFNFIPIFAAPREIEGIEKYYIIKPSSRGGGIVVDERHTKIAQYKNANATVL